MGSIEKRRSKGTDYWIERCDIAEDIIENFESVVSFLLGSMEKQGDEYVVVDKELFEKGVAKAQLEDNVHAEHLGIAPYPQEPSWRAKAKEFSEEVRRLKVLKLGKFKLKD